MTSLGTVYLIHFDRGLSHARHYIGWTQDLPARLARHRAGVGSKLMRAVGAAGIPWRVVRTWTDVDRHFERSLKNQKNAGRLCPRCEEAVRARRRAQQRAHRAEGGAHANAV